MEYSLDADGRLTVHNDTALWYRYIDMTTQAEALFRFIDLTIDTRNLESIYSIAQTFLYFKFHKPTKFCDDSFDFSKDFIFASPREMDSD